MHLQLPYEHTQVGWVSLASALLPLVPLSLLMPTTPDPGARAALLLVSGVLLVVAALFSTLSVRLDETELRLRFGLGVIRRRFALSEIIAFREVANPWQYGWGIRRYPGGILYNVSGLSAIEMALSDGRRIRVGTDDPSTLFLALESQLGTSPAMPEPTTRSVRDASPRRLLVLGLVGVIVIALGTLMHFQAKPPIVTVTAETITIDNLFYGEQVSWAEVREVALLPVLPCVLARTNGYAANGTLRGWFALKELGRGKLFVESSQPPYIAIHLRSGFIIVNFADVQETLRVYQSLSRHMGRRATTQAAEFVP